MSDVAYFDGCCEPGNPGGHGGWGFVIFDGDGQRLSHRSGYIPAGPQVSNNVAEYQGATECVRRYSELRRDGPVTIKGDSKLVVMQMLGKWQVRKGLYIPYYQRLKALVASVQFEVHWRWIPRDQNGVADELSTRELRERGIPIRLGRGG